MPKGGNGGGGAPGGGDGGGVSGPLSLNGNRKDNILIGSDYGDNIRGNDGNDVLIGKGNDRDNQIDLLIGGSGDDILIGDSGTVEDPTEEAPLTDGADRLFGGTGNDSLYGGGGDDDLQGGDGLDDLDGGSGFDIARYSADDYSITVLATETANGDGFVVTFSQVTTLGGGEPGLDALDGKTEVALNIEGIVGTYYDDDMTGADSRDAGSLSPEGFVNVFDGYYGNDTLTGGAGKDCLSGGGDDDTIDGMGGDDLIIGGSGYDNLTGGTGADTFVYLSASDGVDVINDFSGAGDDGDKIDLTALDLTAGGTVDAIIDGFVFTDLAGTSLYVDLDGGGAGDGAADDVLIAFSADFGTINVNSDVLI